MQLVKTALLFADMLLETETPINRPLDRRPLRETRLIAPGADMDDENALFAYAPQDSCEAAQDDAMIRVRRE